MKRLLNEGMDANVAALGPKSHGVTPLHLAAKGGHIQVMDELLERGANIDARTKGACGCKYIYLSYMNMTSQFSSSFFPSLFGLFRVPPHLYPWVLLLVIQLLMPGVSFLGHLSGILVGYLCKSPMHQFLLSKYSPNNQTNKHIQFSLFWLFESVYAFRFLGECN